MRAASSIPCIRLEKSATGSAFLTVTEFTVNGRNMRYILCYMRLLTDVLIVGAEFFFLRFLPGPGPKYTIIYNSNKTHLK